MATERAANGEIPVEALLAQLRRAAEQDGVEDVDAVVAEFATYVRAQAPRIAAQRAGRRNGLSFSGALLTAGALSVAAFGAVASGLVTNPFLPSTPSGSDVSAGTDDRDTGAGDLVLAGLDGTGGTSGAADDGQRDTGTADGTATADTLADPAAATEFTETAPMTFTDPDALAVLAEQRSAGPTPPPSTTPVAPSTTAPDPANAAEPADATTATATTTPSNPSTPSTPSTSAATDTTTTLPTPVLDASTGPETLVSPSPADQQQSQQNDAFTDEGGAG